MQNRRLGRTGLRISEIGFGGWAIGGNPTGYGWGGYGPADDDASRVAIKRALELGVTFFDTADIYGNGHSEELLGEVIDAWPDKSKIVVATKGGINFYRAGEPPDFDFTPYSIANAVQHSRARLRREKLDVYLLMNPPIDLLIEKAHVRETLKSLQRVDYIGAVGVSVASCEDGIRLLASDFPLDVIEAPFSLLDQSAALGLFVLSKKRRIGVIAREVLANGFLGARYMPDSAFEKSDFRAAMPPDYRNALIQAVVELKTVLATTTRSLPQAALRFALDDTNITVALAGARTAAQVAENVAAASLPPLTDAERIAIHNVFFPEDEMHDSG